MDRTCQLNLQGSSIEMEQSYQQNYSQWELLDISNKVFPMIVKKGMSSPLYWIFAVITAICTLFVFGYFSTLSFINNVEDDPMYAIIFSIAFLFKAIARIITMYYYHSQFDYPWRKVSNNIDHPIIQTTKKRITFWFISATLIFLAQIIRNPLN